MMFAMKEFLRDYYKSAMFIFAEKFLYLRHLMQRFR